MVMMMKMRFNIEIATNFDSCPHCKKSWEVEFYNPQLNPPLPTINYRKDYIEIDTDYYLFRCSNPECHKPFIFKDGKLTNATMI